MSSSVGQASMFPTRGESCEGEEERSCRPTGVSFQLSSSDGARLTCVLLARWERGGGRSVVGLRGGRRIESRSSIDTGVTVDFGGGWSV